MPPRGLCPLLYHAQLLPARVRFSPNSSLFFCISATVAMDAWQRFQRRECNCTVVVSIWAAAAWKPSLSVNKRHVNSTPALPTQGQALGEPGPLQRQNRGLCRLLSLQDRLLLFSYAASNFNGKGIASSDSRSAGSTLPCQTDGEQDSAGERTRLTSLHLRFLFSSGSSYVSSRPS